MKTRTLLRNILCRFLLPSSQEADFKLGVNACLDFSLNPCTMQSLVHAESLLLEDRFVLMLGWGGTAVPVEVSGQDRLSPQIQSILVCPYQI